ncbi:resolvase domain-containing protein [Vibrio ichthyoenteri ATCC 700023]|uniref:Resolvase domain-containing protein n=1 Tax=Vibrio ichthyoenteri ATCC 700023 TaxID=870968 RepID=F9S8F1_9VIBR|nr:recombinase family protein [Vibrio ichthyoenteri]EGU29987.1 resolvase domain-containing protein [Vibrio ichthyoenteri ATCC 700023]
MSSSDQVNKVNAKSGQKYIYARTSTVEQNVEQQAGVLHSVWPNALIFKEQLSGRTLERPELIRLSRTAQCGDSILVLSVSRLGRNAVEVLQFIESMKDKRVAVHVHDLGMLDVTSSTGKIVLTTLAAVAEMQRDEILEKQRIGIDRAKAEGKYKGKQQSPKTIRACEDALKLVNENGLSKEKAAKASGIGIATLYRYIKEN